MAYIKHYVDKRGNASKYEPIETSLSLSFDVLTVGGNGDAAIYQNGRCVAVIQKGDIEISGVKIETQRDGLLGFSWLVTNPKHYNLNVKRRPWIGGQGGSILC